MRVCRKEMILESHFDTPSFHCMTFIRIQDYSNPNSFS